MQGMGFRCARGGHEEMAVSGSSRRLRWQRRARGRGREWALGRSDGCWGRWLAGEGLRAVAAGKGWRRGRRQRLWSGGWSKCGAVEGVAGC